MKSLVLAALVLTTSLPGFAQEQPTRVSCTQSQLPAGATSGFRERLSGGGFGFCQPTACNTANDFLADPVAGKCVKEASLSWLTKEQSPSNQAMSLVLRAQSSRVGVMSKAIEICPESTADANDFSLISGSAEFSATSRLSAPIEVQIKKALGPKAARKAVLSLGNCASQSANKVTINFESVLASKPVLSLSFSPPSINPGDVSSLVASVKDDQGNPRVLSKVFSTSVKVLVGADLKTIIIPKNASEGSIEITAVNAGSLLASIGKLSSSVTKGDGATLTVSEGNVEEPTPAAILTLMRAVKPQPGQQLSYLARHESVVYITKHDYPNSGVLKYDLEGPAYSVGSNGSSYCHEDTDNPCEIMSALNEANVGELSSAYVLPSGRLILETFVDGGGLVVLGFDPQTTNVAEFLSPGIMVASQNRISIVDGRAIYAGEWAGDPGFKMVVETDGTQSGSQVVINLGAVGSNVNGGYDFAELFAKVGHRIVFKAGKSSGQGYRIDLMMFDPTISQNIDGQLPGLCGSSSSNPCRLVESTLNIEKVLSMDNGVGGALVQMSIGSGNRVYAISSQGNQPELLSVLSGSAPNTRIEDAIDYNGGKLLVVENGDGRNVWLTQGSNESTQKVTNFLPGQFPWKLSTSNGLGYFQIDSAMYRTNGTAGGTTIIAHTGGPSFYNYTLFNAEIFASINDAEYGSEVRLLQANGFQTIDTSPGSSEQEMCDYGGGYVMQASYTDCIYDEGIYLGLQLAANRSTVGKIVPMDSLLMIENSSSLLFFQRTAE